MHLTLGPRLGIYEIVVLLGAGGMGEVYRAKDLRLGREVALKVRPAGGAADASHLEREARAVAALNHPSIVVLYTVEDDRDVRFLTIQVLKGQNHLAHGNEGVRNKQAIGLREWSKDKSVDTAVVVIGDLNFDYHFKSGKGNAAFAKSARDNVLQWVRPVALIDTNWAD